MATAPGPAATAGRPPSAAAAALAEWTSFLDRARQARLDPDTFAEFVPAAYEKAPIPSVVLADLVLRPPADPRDRISLDPRFLQYIERLHKQGRVDTASVLRALWKYSSAQGRVQGAQDAGGGGGGGNGTRNRKAKEEEEEGQGTGTGAGAKKDVRMWRNSYYDEETIFWRLAQAVNQGWGIKSGEDVVRVAKMVEKWMVLFTDAAAAISSEAFGSMAGLQGVKDETADARNAFILLLLAYSQNELVLSTLSRPICKGKEAAF